MYLTHPILLLVGGMGLRILTLLIRGTSGTWWTICLKYVLYFFWMNLDEDRYRVEFHITVFNPYLFLEKSRIVNSVVVLMDCDLNPESSQ